MNFLFVIKITNFFPIRNQVIYIVEWRCRQSGAAGHTVCQKTHEVVSNMPPGKPLEIHVAVRLRGPLAPGVDSAPEVRFAGPWVETQTLNPKDGALAGKCGRFITRVRHSRQAPKFQRTYIDIKFYKHNFTSSIILLVCPVVSARRR